MPDEQPSKAKTCFRGEGLDKIKKILANIYFSTLFKDKEGMRHYSSLERIGF